MKKRKIKIAILGWGSLLWEGGPEFDKWIEKPWQYDGPKLKIEFSRVSESRHGALTLVIDDHGSSTPVAWCLSKRAKLEDVVADLRCRESTTNENIRSVRLGEKSTLQNSLKKDDPIVVWARKRKLDAVVWTALKSNFDEKVKKPFSVKAVVAYVKTLCPIGKVKAAEYVWKAPDFVKTKVRSALQQEPWFSKPGSI
ncbi:MAG: hypothetical protein ABSD64_12170 [Terriglobales bacterium]